jgi:hypothetical protein
MKVPLESCCANFSSASPPRRADEEEDDEDDEYAVRKIESNVPLAGTGPSAITVCGIIFTF